MRRLILVTSIFIGGIIAAFGCGGSTSATPTSEGTAPISIETLEGDTVGTDSTFQYGFDKAVDTSTVSVTNFFIQLTSSGECNPDNALYLDTVKITCEDSTCTFDPNPDAETKLSGGTKYTFCITSDINGIDVTLSFSFTTEGLSISSVVRADDLPSGGLSSTAPDDRLSGTVANATMTVTFSVAMDAGTVTTDNITLTCGSQSQEISIAAADSENKVFTITPSSALLQASECTLAIGTGVKDADGNALAEAASYLFNTKCASTDTFDSDTFSAGCWTLRKENAFYPDLTTSGSYYSIDTENGLLNFAAPSGYTIFDVAYGGDGYYYIEKQSTSEELTIIVSIPGVQNMDTKVVGVWDGILLSLSDSSNMAWVVWGMEENGIRCGYGDNVSGQTEKTTDDGCPTASQSNQLKLVKDGDSFSGWFYNHSSSDFEQIAGGQISGFGETYTVVVQFVTGNADGTFSGSFDSVTFEVGGATDQD